METLLTIPTVTLVWAVKQLKSAELVEIDGIRFERLRKNEIKKAKKGEMNMHEQYDHLIQKEDCVLCWYNGELQVKKVLEIKQVNRLMKIKIDTKMLVRKNKWVGKNKIIARVYRPITRIGE